MACSSNYLFLHNSGNPYSWISLNSFLNPLGILTSSWWWTGLLNKLYLYQPKDRLTPLDLQGSSYKTSSPSTESPHMSPLTENLSLSPNSSEH